MAATNKFFRGGCFYFLLPGTLGANPV